MPDEQDGDIFDLQMGGEAEEAPSTFPKRRAKKKKRRTTAKKAVKKKTKKTKPPAEEKPRVEEDLTSEDMAAPQETGDDGSETRIAGAIDRNALSAQYKDALADTMPKAEDPMTRAKRENPAVARWDSFLSSLSKGTMELLYEMGISGLEEGSRPLTNFRRSDLIKPKGVMLNQHADAIEGEMAKLDLTLLPEVTGAFRSGDRLPNNVLPPAVRDLREIRRRSLRSTM